MMILAVRATRASGRGPTERGPTERGPSPSLFGALVLLLMLSGCATTTPMTPSSGPASPAPVEEPASDVSAGESAAAEVQMEELRPSPGISVALREESARAAADGNPERAMALLERAIRIEPRRADLWLDLAELHLSSGDPEQAELHARRARAMAPMDPEVDRRVRALEARIRALREAG